eukprot:gene356-11737_t
MESPEARIPSHQMECRSHTVTSTPRLLKMPKTRSNSTPRMQNAD